MLFALDNRAAQLGVDVHDKTEAIALIHDGETCLGAIVRCLKTGALRAYLARATLIASGGFGRIYRASTNAVINDGGANMVAQRPDRLRGTATRPMQNADAAVAELERVVKDHGFRSIELGCTIVGDQLAEKRYRPVLKRAQELKVFIFTHPHFTGERCGLESYYLSNLVGFPLDTVTMAAHLMFSGALDELPQLQIVLAHGGGYLPYQIGRLAHGYAMRKEPRVNKASSPRELLRRFYFDALTHDDKALAFLIGQVGADRVTLGTDAPFDMGEENPLSRLDTVAGLSAADRDRVLGLNALTLLGEKA